MHHFSQGLEYFQLWCMWLFYTSSFKFNTITWTARITIYRILFCFHQYVVEKDEHSSTSLTSFCLTLAHRWSETTSHPVMTGISNSSQLDNFTLAHFKDVNTRVIISVSYSIVTAINILGNGISMWLLVFRTSPKTASIIFMINLTLTDLALGAGLPFQIAYQLKGYNWYYGPSMCRYSSWLQGDVELLMESVLHKKFSVCSQPTSWKYFDWLGLTCILLSCGELDEKIDTTPTSVCLIGTYSRQVVSLAWHKDWKQREAARLFLSKDYIKSAHDTI